MITIDRDLNIDERKKKYRNCEVICEKNWKHIITNHYYCVECLNEETDDKEKAHIQYGICKECSQPNTGNIIWCSFCNIKYLQQDFDKWTSENKDIDELIKNTQLEASSTSGIIEWIPYNKFTNIKYVATGGFAKVYSANWIDGYISGWDLENKNWKRKKQKKVALKELNDSSKDISKGFLNELKTLVKLLESNPFIVPLYGISQHPDTKNFILVFKYIDNNFLNIQGFTPLKILESRLISICTSLMLIHLNNLVHRDLHIGNILQDDKHTYISDFGLCRPASEMNDQKIYGRLPYIAPEVLRRKPYTEKSDIYSLGIIINTLISGKLPFEDLLWDHFLINEICRYGKRPEIRDEIPSILKDLIQKCWDEIPENRPTIEEIIEDLTSEELMYEFINLQLDLTALPSSTSSKKYKGQPLDVPDLSELEPMPTMQIATATSLSPKVLVKGVDPAVNGAVAVQFPNTFHMHCIWHVNQNLLKQLKGKLGSDFDNFIKDIYTTRNSLTKELFNTGKYFTAGVQTTSRNEGENSVLKLIFWEFKFSLFKLFDALEERYQEEMTIVIFKEEQMNLSLCYHAIEAKLETLHSKEIVFDESNQCIDNLFDYPQVQISSYFEDTSLIYERIKSALDSSNINTSARTFEQVE
ncbi:kinase-like domain-containing protein [Rhizophagus diaphanus]|nr:kinase-like domain-containing protein [Rhizophagus diaphanus] [Rhizophagus sp. MUCL 43196]